MTEERFLQTFNSNQGDTISDQEKAAIIRMFYDLADEAMAEVEYQVGQDISASLAHRKIERFVETHDDPKSSKHINNIGRGMQYLISNAQVCPTTKLRDNS